ncbi:hypothetical protein GCM10011391_22400 [Pullulanibacillus camelliae]|uniref:KTSC domain-containing protein n=1 Tax=Pullulanibacillus camelliae TaxID=1707096 RepID=A0A8J2YHI7_9BACL|nr:KTSC domain-containing protein [Pullulanibacillus camelliae]GGE43097.1 hypothetical protein GCM10011391_22400 [Pullulanibacillus camelliae]
MPKIHFDRTLSHLETFDTIAYNPLTETLTVYFDNGETAYFSSVPEKVIFYWLITENKEAYLKETIMKKRTDRVDAVQQY